MARYNPDGDLTPLYDAVDRLRTDCLVSDGSLLEPGRSIWTRENFAELQRTFVDNIHEGEGSFFEKLRVQLSGGTPAGYQLMAELIWVLYAFQRRDVSPLTKDQKVREVWSWSGELLPANVEALASEVLAGVGRAGQGFANNRWRELVLLIRAMQDLKDRSAEERRLIVSDSTKFAEWLDTHVASANRQLRHILPFLLFPDSYERISAGQHKRDILVGLKARTAAEVSAMSIAELDAALAELRIELEKKHGSRVDFYADSFKGSWQSPRTRPTTPSPAKADEEGPQPAKARFDLNTIFYGPPGSGKTFGTMRRAVEVCLGSASNEPHLVREEFEELLAEGRIKFVTFHQSYTYEDFVEGLRPTPTASGMGFALAPEPGVLKIMADRASKNSGNHVLIIDEINRANISKVLGELITLLEEDKRRGKPASFPITLPYSKTEFCLPPNLYIVGTMNTADRSISLIDTALRRRFTFEEFRADAKLLSEIELDDSALDLSLILETINQRLQYFLGDEAQVGHAWFMAARTKADLDRLMAHKIIPLLKEYFHDDLHKVWVILGGADGFLSRSRLPVPPGAEFHSEDRFAYRDVYAAEGEYPEEAYLRLIGPA